MTWGETETASERRKAWDARIELRIMTFAQYSTVQYSNYGVPHYSYSTVLVDDGKKR